MADELISRQAALDTVKFKTIDDGGVLDDCIMQVLAHARSKLDKLPAVDAVPVVRCRDCKWYEQMMYSTAFRCCRTGGMEAIEPNGFCSLGERREENAAD